MYLQIYTEQKRLEVTKEDICPKQGDNIQATYIYVCRHTHRDVAWIHTTHRGGGGETLSKNVMFRK